MALVAMLVIVVVQMQVQVLRLSAWLLTVMIDDVGHRCTMQCAYAGGLSSCVIVQVIVVIVLVDAGRARCGHCFCSRHCGHRHGSGRPWVRVWVLWS